MPRSLSKNLRRRGALPALTVPLGLAAWFVLASLVEIAFDFLVQGPDAVENLQRIPLLLLEKGVPLLVGVFLSLWMIAPIAGELQLRFVIARAALATGVGAVLSAIVGAVMGLLQLAPMYSLLFGPVGAAASPIMMLRGVVTSGVSTWLYHLPLVVLAGVFLWLWLRDREPKHPVAGMLDEV